MAPSDIDKSLSGIKSSGSKKLFSPKPSQLLQAPWGLLKENILGSISSKVKPDTGQEKFDENTSKLLFSKSYMYTRPLDILRHNSILSASLFSKFLEITSG